jgi:hypothetical protein
MSGNEAINALLAGTLFVTGIAAMIATAPVCPAVSGAIAYCLPMATKAVGEDGPK